MPLQSPDGSILQLSTDTLIALGGSSIVLRQGRYALKIPSVCSSEGCEEDEKYIGEGNCEMIELEKRVYQRVGHFDGIAECINISENGILLAYYPKGNLEDFMSQPETEVDKARKAMWILSPVGTLRHFHKKKVLLDDMALRNILITDDLELKMIDFGQCAIFPMDVDINCVSDHNTTAKADIFHLGCLIFSIVVWKKYHYDLFENRWVFPSLCSLPTTDGLFCGGIIRKCWLGAFSDIEQAYTGVHAYLQAHAYPALVLTPPPKGLLGWAWHLFGRLAGWFA